MLRLSFTEFNVFLKMILEHGSGEGGRRWTYFAKMAASDFRVVYILTEFYRVQPSATEYNRI